MIMQPTLASHTVGGGTIVPEAFGNAIPTNSKDLLKFIRAQKLNKQSGTSLKNGASSGMTGNLTKERLKMLDEQREQLEMRLMKLEDYYSDPLEKHRLLRIEECNKMEAEDSLSSNLTVLFKQYDYDRFKANILRQVELREAKEKQEREARKLAAEERRKAVVERLRLQAELEERRKREAEEALKRLEEESLRKQQWEINRLASDQASMPFEDQLSMLVEQEFREIMERKLWQQREKEKLLAWEEEQRKKDIIEEEKRKARMAELEEKKRKLEILRKQQQQQKAKASDVDMKEEQDRLNKQLRIQNKAKFVSKRGGQAPAAVADEPSSRIVDVPIVESSLDTSTVSSIIPVSVAVVSNETNTQVDANKEQPIVPDDLDTLRKQYREEIKSINSVDELREKIKSFSQEKRALRLDQRQAMALPNGSGRLQELQHQLRVIDMQYLVVEERLQELSSAITAESVEKGQSVGGVGSSRPASARETNATASQCNISTQSMATSEKPAPLHRGVSAAAIKLQQAQTSGTNSTAAASTYSLSGTLSGKTATTSSKTTANNNHSSDGLLREIDRALREGQRLLGEAPASPTGMVDVSTLLVVVGNIEKKILNSSQSSSALHSLGYSDRLGQMQSKLRNLLQQLQEQPAPVSAGSKQVSPRLSPRPCSSGSNRLVKKTEEISKEASTEPTRNPPSRPQSGQMTASSSGAVNQEKTPIARKVSVYEQEVVERIDQDIQSLNSHTTVLSQSKSAPIMPHNGKDLQKEKEEEEMEDATVKVEDEDENEEEEEEEDPEKLPGWQECINSSLFHSAAHHAAYFGYLEVLQFLCKYFDCFIMDEKGRTPLFYAALNNQLQCVAHLVGLDPRWVDVGDHNGDTLLHAAAMALNNNKQPSQEQPNCEVLEFLLSCEANPDIANHQGMTSSHIAKSVAALSILAKHKAQLYCIDSRGRLPIWYAAFDNREDCLKFLLSNTPRAYILWPDEAEGDTCVHVAAKQGHVSCLEIILTFFFDTTSHSGSAENGPSGEECLYVTNKRQYTIAHCAANAGILRVLYEYGMNLFIPDGKEHMPLFLMSFYNRMDCVVYLLDMATSSTSITSNKSTYQKKNNSNIAHADRQGDTALHIACIAGHTGVVHVLLLYLSNERLKNKQGFRPSDLARKAGHIQLAEMVEYYESIFHPTLGTSDQAEEISSESTSKNELMQKVLQAYATYGARWTKCYDVQYDAAYYFDHVTNEATWEKPSGLDLLRIDEEDFDTALQLLKRFYNKYNPEKMGQINDILFVYRRRFTELFMTLAQRYALSDLSIFKGIHFHDGQVTNTKS